jgi:hypothetical protein
MYNCWGNYEPKLIFFFIFKVKRHNFDKNNRIMTKLELDLHIPLMYLHVKFELNVKYCWGDNERKSNISSRGITLSKTWDHDQNQT